MDEQLHLPFPEWDVSLQSVSDAFEPYFGTAGEATQAQDHSELREADGNDEVDASPSDSPDSSRHVPDRPGSREDAVTYTTYYLSGPMRGVPDHNYPTFAAVEAALALDVAMGEPWEILNPCRNFDGDKTRETTEYMKLDLEMVLESDVIVLLPGWRESEGARREVELATWAGKRFMLALEDGFKDGVWYFEEIEHPDLNQSPRASALAEATQLVTGDRNSQYGPPTQDFERTAGMATAFGFRVNGKELNSYDVAIFMMMLKTSRLAWTPQKRDSWVDAAGYAACGYECAVTSA